MGAAPPPASPHPLEHRAGNLLALSFPALAMADQATAALAVVVLWALATLPRHWRQIPATWREHRRLVVAFGGFFLWAAASLLLSGSGPRDLGLTLRLPMLLLALPLLVALNIDRRYVWWGLWLGAMSAFWIAGWDRYVNHAERAGQSVQFVIHFGDLAVLFALLVPLGWRYWWSITAGRWLMAVAVAAGLLASAWSGTRGAWLAVPVLGLYVLFSPVFPLARRGRAALSAGALLAGLAVVLTPAFGVRERSAQLIDDVADYVRGGDVAPSSAGQRLALWRLGWEQFVERPLTGSGAYRLQPENRARAARGAPIPPAVLEFGHAHNQFVEALATGGLLGFTALAALFVLPWRAFGGAGAEPGAGALAAAGRACLLAFGVFCLSQSMFNHQGPLGVFAFLIVYFAVLSRPVRPAQGASRA